MTAEMLQHLRFFLAADFSWPGVYRLLMIRHLASEAVGPPELAEPSLCWGQRPVFTVLD